MNYAPILPSVDGQTIKNDEIGATIAEKTEDVEEPEEELEEDEIIFNFEENDSFALSPLFSIIAGNTILNSRPQEEEKEDEREDEGKRKNAPDFISLSLSKRECKRNRNRRFGDRCSILIVYNISFCFSRRY